MSIYSEIKKYLLFLVGFFCCVLLGHVVLLYIYHDAIKYPLPGGTINVGMMGKQPTLNLLEFDTRIENNPNDALIHFMYRGLLRYSMVDKKIVSDLATCATDTFPIVRCTLNPNALWDDGEKITLDDIIATYAFFRKHAMNDYTKTQLAGMEIVDDADTIVVRFKSRDVTNIQALFLPTIREKNLSEGWSGRVEPPLSYSGPYIYEERQEKKDTLILGKNPHYTHTNRPFFFGQVRIGFGETNREISRAIDPDVLLTNSTDGVRGKANPYIRPVLYGAFLHATRIPESMRKTLVYDVLKTLEHSNNAIKPEDTIFLGDVPSHDPSQKENAFFQTVFSLGYSFGGTFQTPENTTEPAVKNRLTYITAPSNETPVFLPNAQIEIRGSFPNTTTRIIINNYTLKNFSPRKKSFIYVAKKEFGNLVSGKNVYRVSFYSGTKLLAEESITIFHSTNGAELKTLQSQWEKENTPKPVPSIIPANLDPKKLYNRSGKVLSFRIIVPTGTPYLSLLGKKTAEKLREFGADTEVIELPTDTIKKQLSDPNFSYDIIFTGISLGLFHYNITPFFHSQNIKTGYNIARINNTSLDILLNRLTDRLYYNAPDKLRDIQIALQKILEKELVYVPFGSPYEYTIMKESVLGIKPPEFLVGREMIAEMLTRGYFKEGYRRGTGPKTFFSFFVWLKNELFSST